MAMAGCRSPSANAVEQLVVADSVALEQMQGVGLSRETLRQRAMAALDAAPGFAPRARVRDGAHRYFAQLFVQRAEVLASGQEGVAVAHVVLGLELSPVEGGRSLRASERAAEPVGTAPGALKDAVAHAAATAIERLARAVSVELGTARKSSAELVKDLSAPEARVRERAIGALADRGQREAVPAVIERLRDPDPEVVERAVGALAQLRDPRAAPALIELARRRDPDYVANLARILGDIGGPDAQAWLLTMAAGHPDERVRVAAREALDDAARAARARGEKAGAP